MSSWGTVTLTISFVPQRVVSDISNWLEIQILTLMMNRCDEIRLNYTYSLICSNSKASNDTVLPWHIYTNSMTILRTTELLNATLRCLVLLRNVWLTKFVVCNSCIDDHCCRA